jgi:hypothetical protein
MMTEFQVWAWIGEDEFGSGVIGLKQGDVPAGRVPLVSTQREKLDRPYLRKQLQAQADAFGKTIRLVRLALAEECDALEPRP